MGGAQLPATIYSNHIEQNGLQFALVIFEDLKWLSKQ